MLDELSPSDKIQIVLSLISTLVAVISIFIAVASLIHTNKITKEANRAYISIYLESIRVTSTPIQYLIIRNFGLTGATINSVSYHPKFESKYKFELDFFSTLNNHFLAPGQSFKTACSFEKPYEPITFTIDYNQGKKNFVEKVSINPEAFSSVIDAKVTSDSDISKTLQYAVQEIIRINL